jgi:hypothetical protein
MSHVSEQMIARLAEKYSGVHQANIRTLAEAVQSDKRFARINPEALLAEIEDFATATGEPVSRIKTALDHIHTSLGNNAMPKSIIEGSGDVLRSVQQESSWLKRTSDRWQGLSPEHKVNAGMWGVGALLGVFGFARSASHAVQKDEQDKNHIQWSNVGVALLQAAMTAGCAYMGVQSIRAGRA